MEVERVLQLLKELSHEIRDVDVGHSVDRVHISQLSPVRFATQYVARNKPVIITGALNKWPAMRKWDAAYLSKVAGESVKVTVDLTPTGRGDSVTDVEVCPACGPMAILPSSTPLTSTKLPAKATAASTPEAPASASAAGSSPEDSGKAGKDGDSGSNAPAPHVSQGSQGPPSSSCTCGGKASSGSSGVEDGSGGRGGGGPQGPREKWFITPLETQMTVSQFFKFFRDSRATQGPHRVVPYVQHQNSSFTEEWAFLKADVPDDLTWADEVFGGPPEAVNLWIGDERSVTSFHKDHYENLYGVVRGTKVFHLLPPSDVYRMGLRNYPAAHYVLDGQSTGVEGSSGGQGSGSQAQAAAGGAAAQEVLLGRSRLVPELKQPAQEVAWTEVEVDPRLSQPGGSSSLFHDPALPKPLVAEVGPGELLYLPAIWYHRVSQVCTQASEGHDYVIAVNQWYDMAFDARWAHFKLVEGLAVSLSLAPAPLAYPDSDSADEEDDDGSD